MVLWVSLKILPHSLLWLGPLCLSPVARLMAYSQHIDGTATMPQSSVCRGILIYLYTWLYVIEMYINWFIQRCFTVLLKQNWTNRNIPAFMSKSHSFSKHSGIFGSKHDPHSREPVMNAVFWLNTLSLLVSVTVLRGFSTTSNLQIANSTYSVVCVHC